MCKLVTVLLASFAGAGNLADEGEEEKAGY